MRLFEAIIDANHRAIAGDREAGLRPGDYPDALPVAALSCIDVRLNPLLPEILGIPEEHFVWLRNAGNIITGPLSSTMRSLSLACAVKGAKEIAIIGHTDCQVCKTGTMQLIERLKAMGVERQFLPDNVNEYFGVFASERQNVIKGCEIVRSSPLIGPKIPVHGLLVEVDTGKIEWLVNGYQAWETMGDRWNEVVKSAGETVDAMKSMADFNIGEMKFPETKIGETVTHAADWLSQKIGSLELKPGEALPIPPMPPVPPGVESAVNVAQKMVETVEKHWPKAPLGKAPPGKLPPKMPSPPPPMRPRMQIRKGGK